MPQGSRREATRRALRHLQGGRRSRGIDFASYLVARLPATFAAVSRVLEEAAALRPGFAPASLLDAGSGPGTASWAAAEVWPGLRHVTFLDNAPDFLKLAAGLAAHGPPAPDPCRTPWRARSRPCPKALAADLVVAAYALAELPLPRIAAAARRLWAASRSMLVIVEPGTPAGLRPHPRRAGGAAGQGAVPVAPCTHAEACPIAGEDWCHFSVRLARSRAHMHAKGASVPFEDERFAYLVLAREGEPSGARPHHCAAASMPSPAPPSGSAREAGSRRATLRGGTAAAYKQARKLDWGDVIGPATRRTST